MPIMRQLIIMLIVSTFARTASSDCSDWQSVTSDRPAIFAGTVTAKKDLGHGAFEYTLDVLGSWNGGANATVIVDTDSRTYDSLGGILKAGKRYIIVGDATRAHVAASTCTAIDGSDAQIANLDKRFGAIRRVAHKP